MSKRVVNRSINIDGAKLKELLESATGKTLKEISLENGFSDSFLRMVVKSGKATPAAQAVIRRYGIEPSAYKIKPAAPVKAKEDSKQLSIDDLITPDAKDVIKAVVKEAIIETLDNLVCNEIAAYYEPKTQVYTVALKVKKEGLQCKRQ